MLSRLSRLLHSWARGWLILALVTGFVTFEVVTLPRLQAAPGGNVVSLDAQFFYLEHSAILGTATEFARGLLDGLSVVIYCVAVCVLVRSRNRMQE